MINDNMLPVGTLLHGGNYKITRQLSRGGFGNTYVVENVRFDETYAMKEFFMRGVNLREGETVTVSVPDNKATFESQKEKLKKEARRLRQLDNPHIVRVHDLFEERGTVYYVMDFIDGESLSDRLERTGQPLTEGEGMDILRQVLDALSVVHGQSPQLLHLDIKPANIMVDRKGCAYLIDFGASKQLSTDESRTLSTSTGMSYTAGYAPSEQIEQNYERMGPWTDYYALGATLYRLLTLQQPPSPSVIGEDPDEAFLFPKSISTQTQQLIRWMMTPNRKKRPQNVGEIQQFLSGKSSQREEKITSDEKDDNEETVISQKRKAADKKKDVKEETIFESVPPRRQNVQPQKNTQPKEKGEKKRGNNRLFIGIAIASAVLVGLIWLLAGSGMSDGTPTPPSSQDNSSLSYYPKIIDNLVNNMVYVEGGTFSMGATSEQGEDADYDEKPTHQVTLSSFSIGKYEVTQEEWEAVMESNTSKFKGAKFPVEQVSWNDCQEFIRKLNQMTGKKFRLPTEAEWEYAARGGSKSRGYKYAGGNDLGSVAWYNDNSGRKTHEVGQKQPNELGLYDMAGNVLEWCQDWKGNYSSSSQSNPQGPSSGSLRVYRGGSWHYDARYCRVSNRINSTPDARNNDLGLRLAL